MDTFAIKNLRSLSSKLESADLEVEDLSKEILACEESIYETFLGPKPDVASLQKLLSRTTFTFSPKASSGPERKTSRP
ncbi:MAG: hypothetical protein JWQ49_5249 [Edaphobacter sp.]|nr:hypothetical protein [Edaphobacter sp.]